MTDRSQRSISLCKVPESKACSEDEGKSKTDVYSTQVLFAEAEVLFVLY